jgi:hypothetical protein
MHALRLPPRHLLRVGLLALLLTLAVIIAAAAVRPYLESSGGAGSPATEPVQSTGGGTPAWVKDPLAPPALLRSR